MRVIKGKRAIPNVKTKAEWRLLLLRKEMGKEIVIHLKMSIRRKKLLEAIQRKQMNVRGKK